MVMVKVLVSFDDEYSSAPFGDEVNSGEIDLIIDQKMPDNPITSFGQPICIHNDQISMTRSYPKVSIGIIFPHIKSSLA